jgi:hypothetical protein
MGLERSIRLRGPVRLMSCGTGDPLRVRDANPSIMAQTAGTLSPPAWITKSASAAVDVRREREVSSPMMGVRVE